MSDPLFQPLRVGALSLPNRVLMAPMTRSRAGEGDVATESMRAYYAQRASAGMIVSEATQIAAEGKGYAFTPGLYDDAQRAGWAGVVDAVHAAGGLLLAQLWHVGRISHVSHQPDEGAPVAPSAVTAEAYTFLADQRFAPVSAPRALEREEIRAVVAAFRRGAELAKAAGFDGIELHGANGYLVDQFLHRETNLRDDLYGGDDAGRMRFALEVVDEMVDVFGADRVGVRISPQQTVNGLKTSEPAAFYIEYARQLGKLGIAFLDVVESYASPAKREVDERLVGGIREAFGGVYIAGGGYDVELARERIAAGKADAVMFAKAFLANPDLPERFRVGAELNRWDKATFYGGGAEGYTDYPALS